MFVKLDIAGPLLLNLDGKDLEALTKILETGQSVSVHSLDMCTYYVSQEETGPTVKLEVLAKAPSVVTMDELKAMRNAAHRVELSKRVAMALSNEDHARDVLRQLYYMDIISYEDVPQYAPVEFNQESKKITFEAAGRPNITVNVLGEHQQG